MMATKLSSSGELSTTDAMVASLKRADVWPEGEAPQLVETHISHVFLGKSYAYKLKKPVRYDFLDFSSLSKRLEACQQEVLLNKRLAPDVYLGVVPVTRQMDGRIEVNGQGEVIDWLVKMRRLPASLMLDTIFENSTLNNQQLKALSGVLSEFYSKTPAIAVSAPQFIGVLRHHIQANLHELEKPLHGLNPTIVRRIHNRQLQFVALEEQLLTRRVAEGRIKDGHGDLRPEHVCMEERPIVFDCVEFSAEFRQADVLDELCFFAMECDRLGHPVVGETVLADYRLASGDIYPQALASFYKSYRACVRAKVAALRATQETGARQQADKALAERYLRLADQDFGKATNPICVIIRGLIGSGKSTLARHVADVLGMDVLQTDQIRQTLAVSELEGGVGYGEGAYGLGRRRQVYDRMLEMANERLRNRISVILDACFLSLELQEQAYYLATALGVPLFVITCECPKEIAVERILSRLKDPTCLSEARPEHWVMQAHEDEGVIAQVPSLTIRSGTVSAESAASEVVAHLRQWLMAADGPSPNGGRLRPIAGDLQSTTGQVSAS